MTNATKRHWTSMGTALTLSTAAISTTITIADHLWQGTWQQPGNDRERGFEVLLSADGTQAHGIWWYSRVGTHTNIPPHEHGGTYHWKRLPR